MSIEENAEKFLYEDSTPLSSSICTDKSFTENITQETIKNDIYLITKNTESRIPEILTYIQNNSHPIENKLLLLKYMQNLFTKVNFNSEIFLQKCEQLNIFQIIINQYIISDNKDQEYQSELKELFILLLSQISLDKETYHYLFSFAINYINKYNNDNITNDDINNFNSEHLSKILLLLQLYYQTVQTFEEPYNYFFFGGDSETYIKINFRDNENYNKKFSRINEINILLFIKLLPNEIVEQIDKNMNYKILDIYLKNGEEKENKSNISIGIDKDNFLITSFTSKNLVKLPENKMISILFKFNLKEITKTEIFIDNEKIEISKDIIIQDKEKKSRDHIKIKKIKFFNNFIGICSNIIIYKEYEKDKKSGLPNFFLKKEKQCIKPIFVNGIYKEELFDFFLKCDLKDQVDDKSYKQIKFPTNEKILENDIKEIKNFLDNYLIAIYIPNRFILQEKNEKEKIILLKDSINNIDAEFITNSPNLNGIHLFKKISTDISCFGGLNHLLPIIEIMTQNNDLLDNDNLSNYFNLLSSIFMPSYNISLKNENNSNFFFNLSYFFEKIPQKYFDEQLACKLISISTSLIYYQNEFLNLIKQFHNEILLNKIIFFKFKIESQRLILFQIKFLLDNIKNEGFIIDIMLLINIILTYDEDKYNKFCCKFHSEFFNTPSEVYNPELKEILQPIEEIISKFFEIFIREASHYQGMENENENGKMLFKLFEMLALDISPCVQKVIIKYFLNYMKNHLGKYFSLLDYENKMLDITLFLFKTSIFDVKIDALNLILLINDSKKYVDEFQMNNNRTNSWAFKSETTNLIDEEKLIFIHNHILPFYLLGEGILLSSSSKNNEDEYTNIKISKKNEEIELGSKNKKIGKDKKIKKLKKNDFYKIDEDKDRKSMTYSQRETEFNELRIHQNGVCFNYIKINSTQQKVYLSYKKIKMNTMILDLYNNTLNFFKESEQFDFISNLLIRIVSKSDIILICKFLNNIKEKSKNNTISYKLYKNQQFFHWLLETSFQTFMIIESGFDKNKFKPGFTIDPIDEKTSEKNKILSDEEIEIKVKEIFTFTNEFIIDITKKDIYQKLDYIFSWSKYYYELRNNKNNFQNVKEFILKILRNLFKSFPSLSFSDKDIKMQNDYMYYLSMLFEFLTFYNVDTEQGYKRKKSEQINQELSNNFPSILIMELINQKIEKKVDDTILMLSIKWRDYPFYQKIYSFFKPLWIDLANKKKNCERDNIQILKKCIEKKKSFLNELQILFNTFDNSKENNNANKGIKNVFLIFHFIILLFSIVEDDNDIKNLYNDFYLFICLLIISSSTISINENKKKKWPDKDDYQDIQDTIELILCYTLKYYKDKILEIDEFRKKYIKDNNEKKLKYYNSFYEILIESLGNIIKLLGIIYIEQEKNQILITLRKSKPISYILLKNLYTCLEDVNSSKNTIPTEKEDNCINIIIKQDSKLTNSEFIKNIYLFIENHNIQNFILEIIKDPLNQKKLYPFQKIIKRRHNFIISMIPIYNNRLNIDESQTNLCLVPDYWQECRYNKILEKKLGNIMKEFIMEIFLDKEKTNIKMHQKIKEYKKIKKRLFTFKGIWSKEEYFYDPKYHIKYKLLNHYTEDFSKILLTPILDLDYYLPNFSEFETQYLFRNPENEIPIYYLVDLSFNLNKKRKIFHQVNNEKENKEQDKNDKENINNNQDNNNNEKKKEDNLTTKTKKNVLFDLRLINFNLSDDPLETIPSSNSELFSKYIREKHLYYPSNNDTIVDACLVKPDLHICGLFYNNSKEVGFYSSDRTPNNEEEYDFSRKVCFGSIFKPQMNKYNYYYIKISYSEIDFVLKRKYYFKKTGLEIFTTNKKSYFFKFSETELKTVYENIKYYMKNDIEDINIEYSKYEEKIGFFNKNKSIKKNGFYKDTYISISNDIKNMNLKYLYDKWTKWEISTLKLLIYLNLYSNRSFNDINQYPVFPWLTLDYKSNILSKNKNLRPYGTPMGMLCFDKESSERKESFIETWKVSVEENDEEEHYCYRTHYSTSLYVTYYLVRIFPFAYMRLELQGKNFDDPNRLFNSVMDSFWCSTTQRADLRELIPEFFFFPEMFYNMNKFNLGKIKDKETNIAFEVNEIKMPKWSNEDGYIFVNKHRMLLESSDVNEKINEWFNIIFGVKRKGTEAKNIRNLFLQNTYDEEFEESYNKADLSTKIYYCRMVEFGVTPHQIFKNVTNKRTNYSELKSKKHMFINMTEILQKKEEKNIEIINEFQINNDEKNNIFSPIKLFYIQKGEDQDKKKIFILDNKNGIIKTLKINQIQKKNKENKENKQKKILELTESKKDIKLFFPKNRLNSTINNPTILYNKGYTFALGGFWNGNILIENILEENNKKDKNEKLETKIYYTSDKAPITHIFIDKNERFMLCGNNLGTIYVYIIDSKDKTILNLYKILYDHFSPISSIGFNEELNTFITCSNNGYCNLYTIPQCKLVNSFKLKNIVNSDENALFANISLISSSPLPCIIFYFKYRSSLCVCSINGHFIKEQKIDYEIRSRNGIKIFKDNQFIDYLLILDQKNEVINIYNIIDLQIVFTGEIKNYILIDFIISKDFDTLFILVKSKMDNENKDNKEYKILMMKNTKFPKTNEEFDKKATLPVIETENKNE